MSLVEPAIAENMFFLLKKLAGAMLMPLGFSLALIVIGTVLFWLDRSRRLAKYLITAGCGLLLFFSNPFVGHHLAHDLEARYPPLRMDDPAGNSIFTALDLLDAGKGGTGIHAGDPAPEPLIVVLSGGASDDPGLPEADRLTPSSALRVAEAVQIYHDLISLLPAATATRKSEAKDNSNPVAEPHLILSGGPTFNSEPEALPMEKLAESLGVPAENIVLETRSNDTFSEAEYLLQVIGRRPFILVTSAIQMPRAMALFQRLGMNAIPAPANFEGQGTTESFAMKFSPSVVALNQSTIAWHEQVGTLWERLRGQL